MVYAISDNDGFVKIGVAQCAENRLKQLQTGNARQLSVIKEIYTKDSMSDFMCEDYLHRKFINANVCIDGKPTEWFYQDKIKDFLIGATEDLYWSLRDAGMPSPPIRQVKNYFGGNKAHLIAKSKGIDYRAAKVLEYAGFMTLEAAIEYMKIFRIRGIGEVYEKQIQAAYDEIKGGD